MVDAPDRLDKSAFSLPETLYDNVNGELRSILAERFTLNRPETVVEQRSSDGTRKWLLRFADGRDVETVYIPEDDRGALCISSQVGCKMGCTFCETGRMGLIRHLRVDEIVGQVLVAKLVLGWDVRNIVFMGMGEALDNTDAVMQSLHVLNDSSGMSIGEATLYGRLAGQNAAADHR